MSNIVFEDNTDDENEEEIIEDEYIDDEGEDIQFDDGSEEEDNDEEVEENDEVNEDDEGEDIQFDDGSDEENNEKEENEDVDENEDIDINEFYDDAPKKTSRVALKRRKRLKPPKVSKNTIKKNKKNNQSEIVIQNYMIGNIREKSTKNFEKITNEKNCKILERAIFNSVVRKLEGIYGRKLKKSDLDNEDFRSNYISVVYETFVSMNSGVKCKEQIERLNNNKIGLLAYDFRDQKFVDDQETKNIEEPPKAKPGIHRCNKCYHNKDLKHDEERGKRTWYYELQTRSSDEPMTVFITCLDCGFRWKN